MNCTIYTKVEDFQNGNGDAVYDILKSFYPLLKKYAYLLKAEDSFEELQLHVIDALKTMDLSRLSSHVDGVMVQYIRSIVHNQYTKLSQKNRKYRKTILLSGIDPYNTYTNLILANYIDDYSFLFLDEIRNVLTENEYMIILLLYQDMYTITEIARNTGKSRQAVNQTKLRAIKKLKKKYEFMLQGEN